MAISQPNRKARGKRAAAERQRTLKQLREHAPSRDRGHPALAAPAPAPLPARYSLWATSLEELATRCGPHGEAAVQDALWGCVSVWLMHGPDAARLTNPRAVATTAVFLCQTADRVRLGYPSLSGNGFDDRLASLSPDAQGEARLVAAETLADWERADRPGLSSDTIKRTQQYIQACTQATPDQEIAA